jgi:hypothetical protein
MSAWTVIQCLLTLRAEFNTVSPDRDKGADGTIGDTAHTSSSDHTPDEDSDVLRDHDADDKNEVHALDIDSSGPWPDGGWFNRAILALVERERVEHESADIVGRLSYVIWNRRIASRSQGWAWRDYAGSDPHTNHVHFSGRYLSSTEADTRPWGVQGDTMTKAEFLALLADADVRAALCRAVVATDGIISAPADAAANADGTANTHWTLAGYAQSTRGAAVSARTYSAQAAALDWASRFAALDSALASLGAVLAELIARPAGGAPVTADVAIEALREILRDGVAE